MADTTDRRDWRDEPSGSIADRLIEGALRLFLFEPVSAAAIVLLVVGALSNSGVAGFVAFAVSLLLSSHLRKRYARDL